MSVEAELVKGSDGSVKHCWVAMAALLPAVETGPIMWISFEIMKSVVENIGKTGFLPISFKIKCDKRY